MIRAFERATGTHVLRKLPRGVDFVYDLRRSVPWYSPAVVFDVGANVGQSAERFADWFPAAHIHSFEPVRANYDLLRSRVSRLPNVHCHRVALGATSGRTAMLVSEKASLSRVSDEGTEAVDMDTVTGFCTNHGIAQIGYLKIDTEGHDLAVLMGAVDMLDAQRIDAVQVEAGMHPDNVDHVPLEHLKAFLENKNYRVFALYDQVAERKKKQPHLRRVNAVFLSRALIEAGPAGP